VEQLDLFEHRPYPIPILDRSRKESLVAPRMTLEQFKLYANWEPMESLGFCGVCGGLIRSRVQRCGPYLCRGCNAGRSGPARCVNSIEEWFAERFKLIRKAGTK